MLLVSTECVHLKLEEIDHLPAAAAAHRLGRVFALLPFTLRPHRLDNRLMVVAYVPSHQTSLNTVGSYKMCNSGLTCDWPAGLALV